MNELKELIEEIRKLREAVERRAIPPVYITIPSATMPAPVTVPTYPVSPIWRYDPPPFICGDVGPVSTGTLAATALPAPAIVTNSAPGNAQDLADRWG